jgi:hypothetical protein
MDIWERRNACVSSVPALRTLHTERPKQLLRYTETCEQALKVGALSEAAEAASKLRLGSPWRPQQQQVLSAQRRQQQQADLWHDDDGGDSECASSPHELLGCCCLHACTLPCARPYLCLTFQQP